VNLIKDIQEFYALNTESNRLKKLKDPINDSIKTQIKEVYAVADGDSITVNAGDVQAIYQSIEGVSINQTMLMEILKKNNLSQAIKTIEVVDSDVVEQLIYDGVLNPFDIEPCNEKKYTIKLTVKAVKKPKGDKSNEDKGVLTELRSELRGPKESLAQDRF